MSCKAHDIKGFVGFARRIQTGFRPSPEGR